MLHQKQPQKEFEMEMEKVEIEECIVSSPKNPENQLSNTQSTIINYDQKSKEVEIQDQSID